MSKYLLATFSLFFLGLVSANAQCNLRAHFRLDGNPADSSSYLNHGTFYGGTINPTADRFNNPNSAVDFDGVDDYINTFTTYDFQYRTVSFWIKPDRLTGINSIMAHDANTLNYGAFSALIRDGGILEGRAGGTGNTILANNTQIGVWYHVAMVRTNTKNYYYLDGQLIDSSFSNSNGSGFQAYDKLVLGVHRSRTVRHYKGVLDDVKIFDCAFSDQQIDSLYRDSTDYRPPTFASCLLGSWPMDGNANDTSIYANHASFFGQGPTDTTNRFGESNKAYYFDGVNDYLNTFTSYDYPELSLSFWVNAERTGSDIIVSMDDNNLQFGALSAGFSNNNLQGRAGGNGARPVISPMQTNVWHHVVLVRGVSTCYYYWNGQLIDSSATNGGGSISNPYDRLIFGTHRTRTQRFFKGRLDDVFILSCALSPTEVDSIFQAQNPSPLSGLPGDTSICQGDTLILNAPSGANLNFYWDDNSSQASRAITQPGTYWIWMSNGRDTLIDTMRLDFIPKPLVQKLDTVICSGNPLVIDYSAVAIDSVLWNDNDTSRVRNLSGSGIFTVDLFWACGIERDTINLREGILRARVVDTALCDSNIEIGNRNPQGLNFLWSTGSTQSKITVNSTGVYWLQVANQCDTVVDTFRVFIAPTIPSPQIPDTLNICELGDSILIGIPLDAQLNFNWSNNAQDPQQYVKQTGLYTLLIDNGCEQRSLKYEVLNVAELRPEPLPDTALCIGSSLFLDFSQWPINRIRLNGNTLTNGQFRFVEAGQYLVEYEQACGLWLDSFNLDIVDCTCELIMPNAFTPNGDGINDQFRIKSACENFDYRMVIFNRWGIQVFESNSVDDFWDGTYQGEDVPAGSFVYKIWYSSKINGRIHQDYLQGILQLYR